MNDQDKQAIMAAEKYIKISNGEIPRTVRYNYEDTYNYILANWSKYDEVQSRVTTK